MAVKPLFLDIDAAHVMTAVKAAIENLDGTEGELVLDCSALHRIDPGTLRALEDLARVAEEKAAKVALRGVNVDVYKVLKLVKLAQRFSFVN